MLKRDLNVMTTKQRRSRPNLKAIIIFLANMEISKVRNGMALQLVCSVPTVQMISPNQWRNAVAPDEEHKYNTLVLVKVFPA